MAGVVYCFDVVVRPTAIDADIRCQVVIGATGRATSVSIVPIAHFEGSECHGTRSGEQCLISNEI